MHIVVKVRVRAYLILTFANSGVLCSPLNRSRYLTMTGMFAALAAIHTALDGALRPCM